MKKIGQFIVKNKYLIVVVSFLLLIPAFIGMSKTKINYDILVYLPSDIETLKGERILTDDFKMGAFSVAVIDNMNPRDVLNLEDEIRQVDGVEKVVSINDITGTTIPLDILPSEIVSKVKSGDTQLMLITFHDSTSDSDTLDAVEKIREISSDNVKLGGMSSMVLDTMDLSNDEIVIYVCIAVLLCIIVLSLALDSYIVPFILLLNIGIAILYNMGTNIFLGNISYITKAISSVLQLGVTTDFSIFLYHKYEARKKTNKDREQAMCDAIADTGVSVVGSSLTTIAGFLALCTMSLTLGRDIGIVMAKGVFLGVVCVLIIFPALILVFDKYIEKTTHKVVIPKFTHLNDFIIKHYKKIFIVFLILLVPAYYGNKHTEVYYKLDKSLPKDLESSIANTTLKNKFNIASPEMIIIDKNISQNKVEEMVSEIEKVKGIDMVLSASKLSQIGVTDDMLGDITKIYKSDKYQMILVNSEYDTATDELNSQVVKINKIVKKYDKNGILAGEGPLMKDLVVTSDTDFHNVNYTSLFVIFIIMIFVLKSISLPEILILVIEFAIFINMGIPYYSNITIPFIASIVIGTIQLGATIDYAILMTTKFLEERKKGLDKFAAMKNSLDSSVSSIFVSGMCFFAATFGVGFYSKLDMISSLCTLISRGAIVSMIVVVMVLPSFLIIFDDIICKTTIGFKKEGNNMKKKLSIMILLVLMTVLFNIPTTEALTKNETVFSHLDYNGSVKKTVVNEHLTNINQDTTIEDVSNLKNILNINGDEKISIKGNKITFENKGSEIYYKGTIDKELPVDLSITYRLNGEDIKLSDLLGKSGHVEIRLSYSNKDSHIVNINGTNKTLYTPFVVTMGTIIPTKNVNNVEVSNGYITSTGTNNIVVALATPGLYESLDVDVLKDMGTITISYDVKDFKLNKIYSVYTAKLIDEASLKPFNKLDSLYSKVNLLTDSSNQLVEGASKLSGGISAVKNGSNIINNSLNSKISEVESSEAIDSNTLAFIENSASSKVTNNADSIKIKASKILDGTLVVATNPSTKDPITVSDAYNICHSDQASNFSALCTTNGELLEVSHNLSQMYNAADDSEKQHLQIVAQTFAVMIAKETAQSTSVEVAKQVAESAKAKTISSLKELSGALNELNQGIITLEDGSVMLANGLKRFNDEGISVLGKYINGDLKETEATVKELIKLGNEYNTYTMKNEEDKGNTKFVLVVDSKEKKNNKKSSKKK